jgi:hypothetical protein
VAIGVLEEDYSSAWASLLPIFVIAKKHGTTIEVTNSSKLNSLMKYHPFSILKIGHIILCMQGFIFITDLDLNMEDYHIQLGADVQNLCKIIFPMGKI